MVSPQERDDAVASSATPEAAAFVCDHSGTIRWWSKGAERLLGYTGAQALGQSLEQLVLADEPAGDHLNPAAEGTARPWVVRTRQGTTSQLWRRVIVLQGGREERLFLHLVWAQPSCEPGAPAGLEMPREQAGALAMRIAHDFGSLIAPILGNAMLLEEEIPAQEPLNRRLVAIRQASEEARRFAQRLAALDPKRKLSLHPGDLAQVVRDFLPELQAGLRPNVELGTELAACPDCVLVDRKQMGHVLTELALNAQDAMPGGGTLTISVAALDRAAADASIPSGRWVRLQVRDNGKGMEDTLLAHAFEPFVTTKVPSSGGGLGLPIVAAIVRQHEGLFEVDSKSGQGTTFSIYLRSHGPLVADHASGSLDKTPSPGARAIAKGNILLVEDNPMVRRSIEATLRGLGYLVTAVSSGEQCLRAFEQASLPADLLITDVVMPRMSGQELAERVHAMVPGLPVLYMSGYDRSTLASRKQAVAAEHFLQKPFDCEDLSAAIGRALAGRHRPSRPSDP